MFGTVIILYAPFPQVPDKPVADQIAIGDFGLALMAHTGLTSCLQGAKARYCSKVLHPLARERSSNKMFWRGAQQQHADHLGAEATCCNVLL